MAKLNFVQFREEMLNHFNKITKGAKNLFLVNLDEETMQKTYLDSFKKGDNEIFRERRVHECNCCLRFIRDIGALVVITDDNKKVSIWDFTPSEEGYKVVANAMSKLVHSKAINELFVTEFKRVGTPDNMEVKPGNDPIKWEHFYIDTPACSLNKEIDKTSNESLKGSYSQLAGVFKRSLEEISEDAIEVVLELMCQNSLYRGEEFAAALNKFKEVYAVYKALPSDTEEFRNNFVWKQTGILPKSVVRIKNNALGTILMDISEGMELDAAVTRWEKVMAPENYKRPNEIFTPRMVEDAKNKVIELGLTNSLGRRFATIDDIKANNVIFLNRDVKKALEANDPFASLSKETSKVDPKKFNKVAEMKIEDFVSSVVPTATSIEVLLEGRFNKNLMSLIAPKDLDAPSLFKWDNSFAWAYKGNLADSSLKENVKKAGGNVDGIMRCSIQWNDTDIHDSNDLDLHCVEPSGSRISYSSGYRRDRGNQFSPTGGQLDIDIITPTRGTPAVENIYWPSTSKLETGNYKFVCNLYSDCGGKSGFRAEVQIGGDSYTYNVPLMTSRNVDIATVHYDKNTDTFTIKHHLTPTSILSADIWGLECNQWQEAMALTYSPNFWDGKTIGNKHYFFFLKNFINDETPNGFFNEYLKDELITHKKVFAALGRQMAVEPSENQLSGLGFSSTQPNHLFVKVKGATERVIKVLI